MVDCFVFTENGNHKDGIEALRLEMRASE